LEFCNFFNFPRITCSCAVYSNSDIVAITKLPEKKGNRIVLFILGQLQEGSSAETLDNKSNKMRGELNVHLIAISTKLNLALPLRIIKARECFATTLRRAEKPNHEVRGSFPHLATKIINHLDIQTFKWFLFCAIY
jgi:hypothetical protein